MQVKEHSVRFPDLADRATTLLVPLVRERGYQLQSDLAVLGEWKSKRIRLRIELNDERDIVAATGLALATPCQRLAIHIALILHGVGIPVASTILYWFHPDPFPILDFRALRSLDIAMPEHCSLAFWEENVLTCRQLAREWGVDMRTLDRALWQYSAEIQKDS